MTIDNWLVLGILLTTIVVFIWDKIRVDVVAMITVVVLVVSGLLTPEQAFAGFASPAVVTVWAVFIVSGGLYQSGVADRLAQFILRVAGRNQVRLLVIIMVAVGGMSAVMNNIGAVAIFMPAVASICREARMSPSKMLMPLAFAALLGGNMTLIGTPPNILAANIIESYAGLEPFGFFDFFPVGFVSLIVGIIYLVLFGRHLLPDRAPMGGDLSSPFPVRDFVVEARLREGSDLINRNAAEIDLRTKYDINLLQIRQHGQESVPEDRAFLTEGDVLLLEGNLLNIKRAAESEGMRILQDWGYSEDKPQNLIFAEVALPPRSRRAGQTLREMDFRNRYGISVLSMRHQGRSYASSFGDIPLELGDELLVQGPPDRLRVLHENPNFLVLDMPPEDLKRPEKIPVVLAILAIVLATITFGWLDAATAMLAGAIAMVLGGALTMEDAYRSIDWKAVFLIAGLLPLGVAMESTGTARLLADQIVVLVGDLGPIAVLAGIFILTSLLTSFISNAATTVLMVPIAIDAAINLGAAPEPFVMAAVLSASTSFTTPIGHQVNIIIFGPGAYKFTDYFRVGIWLNLLILLVAVLFLPLVWPLFP